MTDLAIVAAVTLGITGWLLTLASRWDRKASRYAGKVTALGLSTRSLAFEIEQWCRRRSLVYLGLAVVSVAAGSVVAWMLEGLARP